MAELTSGPILSFLPEEDTPPIFMLTVIPPADDFFTLVGGVEGFFSGVVVSAFAGFFEDSSLVIRLNVFSVVVLFGAVFLLLLVSSAFCFSFLLDVLLFSVLLVVLLPSFMVEVTLVVGVGVVGSCCLSLAGGVESFFLMSIFVFSPSGCVFFSNLVVDFGENLLADDESLLAFCLNMAIFSAILVGPAAALDDREDSLGESTFGDPDAPPV